MDNPFETIWNRLNNIEGLLLEIKNQPKNKAKLQSSEVLLTIKEAAEFLKLSVPTMYSKVSKGQLPVMKRGNRLYFSKHELLDYIKQGRKLTNFEIDEKASKYLNGN